MRIALVGTRSYGSAVLEAALAHGHDVRAVFAPTGDRLAATAGARGIGVSPEPNPILVRRAGVDVIVAAHSHSYLGAKTRGACELGAFGYHPSLLPRHRGKDAVEWTVRMRDPIAGGTCYWFDSGVDTGPMAAADWCHVDPDWSASDLWRERLFHMGIRLTMRVLEDLDHGTVTSVPQDERFATWEPAITGTPLKRVEIPAIGWAGSESRFRVVGEFR